MHQYIASIEVSNVLLLDESDKYSADWLLRDGEDINLGKSVLNLHDSRINLVTCAGLQAFTTFLRGWPIMISFGLRTDERADLDLVTGEFVPVVCLHDLHIACNLRVHLAKVDVCVGTGCQVLRGL